MFLAEIRMEGFRLFGAGDKALILPLQAGLNVLVGENDADLAAEGDSDCGKEPTERRPQ